MFPSSWTAGWVRQCNCRRMGAVCCPAVGLLDGFGSATAEERGRFVARQLDCWMGSAVQLPKNGGGLLPGSWIAGWVRQCNCRRMGAVCCPAVGLLDGFGSATVKEQAVCFPAVGLLDGFGSATVKEQAVCFPAVGLLDGIATTEERGVCFPAVELLATRQYNCRKTIAIAEEREALHYF